MAATHHRKRSACLQVLFLTGALFLSSCFVLKPFGEAMATAFGSGLYIAEVSRAYYAVHDRWPREFYELVAFCEEEDMMTISDIEDGIGRLEVDIDIFMFTDVRFTPLPDGTLEITYSFERMHPRTKGEATVHMASGSVIVHRLDDDEPCGKVKTWP